MLPYRVPHVCVRFGVKQDHVMPIAPAPGRAVRTRAFPDNFVAKVLMTENPIHHDFDVMAGGWGRNVNRSPIWGAVIPSYVENAPPYR